MDRLTPQILNRIKHCVYYFTFLLLDLKFRFFVTPFQHIIETIDTPDFNHATLGTPTDKQFWKWYAEINEAGIYTLNDEEGDQQYFLSKSDAIASNFCFFYLYFVQ